VNRNYHRSHAILGITLLFLAIVVQVAAQDATFSLTTDLPVAGKMLAQAAFHKAWSGEKFIEYGNWYGPGYWGGGRGKESPGNKPPIDALDAVAQRHDFAYQIAEEMGKIHGPAEEKRLKGIADEIAVREARSLPEDPRDWDPPAPDPESADRHRDRIGFGFAYTSVGYKTVAATQKTLQQLKNVFNSDPTQVTSSGISDVELSQMARQRATDWSNGPSVRWQYRIDLKPSAQMVAENDSVQIDVSVVSTHAATPDVRAGELPFVIYLTLDGSGELSATQLDSSEGSVVLTATRWAYFFSNNGGKLVVKARGRVLRDAGDDPDSPHVQDVNIDVLEGQTTVTVASKTLMELSATPQSHQMDYASQSDCLEGQITARLTDWDGKGIEGIQLKLSRSDGSTREGTTDAAGTFSWTELFCSSEFTEEGQMSADVSFTVSMTSTESASGSVYLPSSDGVTVTVRQEEFLAITGNVFDRRHFRSVPDATVQVNGPNGSETTTTDGNGHFSVKIPADSGHMPQLTGSVTAEGYETASFTATSDGVHKTIHLDPVEVILTGQVVDAVSGEPLDGATVLVTEPFNQLFNTRSGLFSITGIYFGDRVTMSGGAGQHKSYVKSGIISKPVASVTFRLPRGKGDVSGELDTEETDATGPVVLPKIHDLMVWATPADPGVMQNVTIVAQVFPADPGVLVEISMHGTDGYSASISGMTDATGKVRLPIPGAEAGVLDDVIARIVGESVTQRLRYSF